MRNIREKKAYEKYLNYVAFDKYLKYSFCGFADKLQGFRASRVK